MAVAMPEGLVFDANGLLPVVAQDRASGDVLMLAWANAEALAKTAETGLAHFWSRSRKALWRKGETSGNTLRVVEARADCDKDALLLVVEPAGPACHTGTRTCFGDTSPTAAGMLEELARVVRERSQASPEESYTARLVAKGQGQVLKKIGEEATEVVLAASGESDERLASESADLLFHLLVALDQRRVPLASVMDELRRRRASDREERRMNALSYDDYQRLSEGGRSVPVFRELPGDLSTPVSAFLSLAARSERAFLLESVLGGERLARYSFLGRDPIARLEVKAGAVVLQDAAGTHESQAGLMGALRERLGPPPAEIPGLPRFTGGAVGYLTWDAARLFERLPDHHGAAKGTVASFSFYRSLVAFDHVRQRLVLIALAGPASRAEYDRAQQLLDGFQEDLGWEKRPAGPRRAEPPPPLPLGDGKPFRDAVLAAKEHIARGDIFQVVLSRQHTVDCGIDPFTIYRALRMVNPSPYMYFLKDGESSIAGASPEMLVRVEGRRVEARPIAGTRSRMDGRADDAIARELLADEKERAEHLMLVDLGRNDLGRVCRFGSVQVAELMKVEHYSHVAHIVSSVVGELAEGKDALDALAATFPAGTLSGAPKIRAMEIIDALEPQSRGLYGGALGYIDLGGNLDFCIAIRTLLLRAGRATLQTGAGIVADSDPVSEERETEAKAQALFEALRVAGGLA